MMMNWITPPQDFQFVLYSILKELLAVWEGKQATRALNGLGKA
jgi:hypothetical protein